jgi:hypothetical protein
LAADRGTPRQIIARMRADAIFLNVGYMVLNSPCGEASYDKPHQMGVKAARAAKMPITSTIFDKSSGIPCKRMSVQRAECLLGCHWAY